MRATPIVLAAAAAAAIAAAGLLAAHGRTRHPALPAVTDLSVLPSPDQALAVGTSCEPVELARVGARVTALLETASGELWIGTSGAGLVLRAPSGEEAAPVLSGGERFVNALVEHDGLVWAATQGGLLAFDGERRVATLLAQDGVTALARARHVLYAGTARGLHRIQVDGAVPVEATGPAGEPLRVTALAATGARLWIGTPSGAYALSLAIVEAPLLQRTARWHPLVSGAPPAQTNVVTALAAVGEAVVAGTDDGGLVRLAEGAAASCARFAEARANEVNPGAAAAVGGAAVFGTQGGGVLLATPRPGALDVSRPLDLARGEISAVAPGAAGALVGTAAGAVLRLACPGITPAA